MPSHVHCLFLCALVASTQKSAYASKNSIATWHLYILTIFWSVGTRPTCLQVGQIMESEMRLLDVNNILKMARGVSDDVVSALVARLEALERDEIKRQSQIHHAQQ